MHVTRLAMVVPIALGLAGSARAGRFPVGVTTLTFTKTSVTTGGARVLSTVVWYPAVARTGVAETLGRRDAKLRRGHFPLIIYSHGTCGRPTEASYLTTALARQGFVVAAPAHSGNTADDFPACLGGAAFVESALNRAPDVRFVLDAMLAEASDPSSRFHRRLRTEALGIAGVSFGGFTTLLAAQLDPRFTAALPIVPGGAEAVRPGAISIPTLVIGSERDMVVGFAESEVAYQRLGGPRFLVELLGGNHLSVVDDCFNHELGVSFCVAQDISQEDAHRLVLRYALPFMRRYLRGDRAAGRPLVRSVPGVVLQAEPRRAVR
jgi:predicted dienelactone hydrolase